MSQLAIFLGDLGLDSYHKILQDHNIRTLDALYQITEDEMEQFNFKLGHRRKIQREVASRQGYPRGMSLPVPALYNHKLRVSTTLYLSRL